VSAIVAGWLQFLLLVVALTAVHKPLGDYLARVFNAPKYRAVGPE
jgi:K+-transporting ATPase ATPase A chain